MITILAENNHMNIGSKIYAALLQAGAQARYFDVRKLNVLPCYGCGGCTYKTLDQCVFRDDADVILPSLVRSNTFLFISPIVFGSFSFKVKRALDKFALVGDRNYYTNGKELTKGKAGENQFHAIGFFDGAYNAEEAQAFTSLVNETQILTSMQGICRVLKETPNDWQIQEIASEINAT